MAAISWGDSSSSDLGGSIEDLTGEPAPHREPGELSARVRTYMGEADPLPRRRDPDAPDVSGLRGALGL